MKPHEKLNGFYTQEESLKNSQEHLAGYEARINNQNTSDIDKQRYQESIDRIKKEITDRKAYIQFMLDRV